MFPTETTRMWVNNARRRESKAESARLRRLDDIHNSVNERKTEKAKRYGLISEIIRKMTQIGVYWKREDYSELTAIEGSEIRLYF